MVKAMETINTDYKRRGFSAKDSNIMLILPLTDFNEVIPLITVDKFCDHPSPPPRLCTHIHLSTCIFSAFNVLCK